MFTPPPLPFDDAMGRRPDFDVELGFPEGGVGLTPDPPPDEGADPLLDATMDARALRGDAEGGVSASPAPPVAALLRRLDGAEGV